MKRLAVLGFGKSGEWAARLALHHGFDVMVFDDRDLRSLKAVPEDLDRHSMFHLAGKEDMGKVDGVILSPGIPPDHPVLKRMASAGVPVESEIEFAWRYCRGTIYGITGSNGKTTVTALTAHLLESAGFPSVPCGNFGLPFAQAVLEREPDSHFVLELSSFQLERIRRFRPNVGALLNLTPDHLDRYETVEDYYRAKLALFQNMGPEDVALINGDDMQTLKFMPAGTMVLKRIGSGDAFVQVLPDHIRYRDDMLCRLDDMKLEGIHNLYNAGFAAAMALLAGAGHESVRQGLETFVPIAHRLERVGERDGVCFYNDSKATNFDSVHKALDSFHGIHWICGGTFKGGDFGEISPLIRERVRCAYLIGDSMPIFAEGLSGLCPTERCGTLDAAIRLAWEAAGPGEVVLLAPGCASFDQFKNYEERGDRFRELAREICHEAHRD